MAVRFVVTCGELFAMTWRSVSIFVSLVLSLAVYSFSGLLFLGTGIFELDLRPGLLGLALLIVGLVNFRCTTQLERYDRNVPDRTIKAGYRAALAVVGLGVLDSLKMMSPVPLIVFLVFAALSAAPFFIAKRMQRPEGACTNCGYDLAGLPSSVCPECGNYASAEKSPD